MTGAARFPMSGFGPSSEGPKQEATPTSALPRWLASGAPAGAGLEDMWSYQNDNATIDLHELWEAPTRPRHREDRRIMTPTDCMVTTGRTFGDTYRCTLPAHDGGEHRHTSAAGDVQWTEHDNGRTITSADLRIGRKP